MSDKPKCERAAFEEWWSREGRFYDPDTEDVSWFDKRKALAEKAFAVAMAQSGNYTADESVSARKVVFANGRVVSIDDDGFLSVGRDRGSPAPNSGCPETRKQNPGGTLRAAIDAARGK